MRNFTEEFPELHKFVGFFFNQDYREFGKSTAEVIKTAGQMVNPAKN